MLNNKLKNTIKSGNVGIIADVDGSLTPPGNHTQLLRYNDILIRAYDATRGALMFLTNNDGRSIDNVAKQIKRNAFTAIGHADANEHFNNRADNQETDFHPIIVSEHATRIRRWEKGKQVTENASDIPTLDISTITDTLPPSEKGTLKDGRPQYQAKENTVCFNFAEDDNTEKNRLINLAETIQSQQTNADDFEVVALLDSVEITPKNTHKKDILDFLNTFPTFQDSEFIIMIGDTETDADVAKELHASGRGAMIAVGNHVEDGDHVLQHAETVQDLMNLLHEINNTIEANKICNFYKGTPNRARRALVAQ